MKYCKNCGSELKENAKFCPKCGSAVSLPEKNIDSKSSEPALKSNVPPVSVSVKTSHFCKNCGTPLKEDSVFCQNCGNRVGLPSEHNIKQNLELYNNIPPVSNGFDEIKPSKESKNEYPPTGELRARKNRVLPFLLGIIPILIVTGITVFLYKVHKLPFINYIKPSNKSISFSSKKHAAAQPSLSQKNQLKEGKVKTAKKGKIPAQPKLVIQPLISTPPAHPKTYRPPKPVYHINYVNHARVAFNTFRSNLESAKAETISFTSEHVSGESSVNFVVISHVYSFASNVSANSIEMFEVEFTAAVPQNINAPQVKIVSRIGGQEGFSAENISYINLSSSGVYKIAIPVRIPEYFITGSYYFNAEVKAPGISLTSNNAYFRVE